MAKVNVHPSQPAETPSQSVIKSANQLSYVTDSNGRKLGLRALPFLEEFRIVETVGPDRAANQVYMNMLNFVLLVAEIDGERIEVPRTHPQVEALIQRAGQEGFAAALTWATGQTGTDQKAFEARVKNGDGTPA